MMWAVRGPVRHGKAHRGRAGAHAWLLVLCNGVAVPLGTGVQHALA